MIVVPVKSESYMHGVADDKTNPAPTHHPAEPAVSVHRVAMDDDEEDLDIENDADDEDDGAGIDMESSHGGSSSAASPAPTPEQGGGGSRGGAGRPGFSIADILQPGFGGNGGTGPAGKRSPSPPPIIRKPIASVLSPNSLNFSIYSLFSGGGNKATAALLRGDKTPTATAKEEPISPPPPPATRLPPHPPVHPLMRPLCYPPPIPPPHAAALSPTDALALHQLPGFQPHHHHHPRFLLASHLQPAAHHPAVRRTPPPPAQHPVDYTVPAVASRQRSTPAAFPALTPNRRDVVTPDAAAAHHPAISKANTTAKRSLPNHVKHHQDSVNKRHCPSGGRGDANAANPPPASSSSPGVKSPSGAAAPGAGQQQNLWPAWVYCTRYSDRPSSGPRTRKVKRKEKRVTSCSSVTSGDDKRPRTAFTADQLGALKREFEENRYLTEERRQRLARDLALSDSQVKIWFQNKRAKMKKASGLRNPLALQLMAQGLYNHSTVPLSDDEDADSPGALAGGLGGGGGSD